MARLHSHARFALGRLLTAARIAEQEWSSYSEPRRQRARAILTAAIETAERAIAVDDALTKMRTEVDRLPEPKAPRMTVALVNGIPMVKVAGR